jgi:putative proteasome-type protease
MTFCLAMRLEGGLIGIGDTRITTGSECITARKITTYNGKRYSFFLMTSGLRSIRDKALTYFDEVFDEQEKPPTRLFKVCNALADQLRRVAEEDKKALTEGGLHFNTHAIVGGQMEKDSEPRLYLLYPEGNWVEIGTGTPYTIIGNSRYGKPVLDRTLTFTDPMAYAFRVGCLAFDSTRISAADVDYPMDVVIYARNSFQIVSRRFETDEFREMSAFWQESLRRGVAMLPFEHLESIFDQVPSPANGAKSRRKSPGKSAGKS